MFGCLDVWTSKTEVLCVCVCVCVYLFIYLFFNCLYCAKVWAPLVKLRFISFVSENKHVLYREHASAHLIRLQRVHYLFRLIYTGHMIM